MNGHDEPDAPPEGGETNDQTAHPQGDEAIVDDVQNEEGRDAPETEPAVQRGRRRALRKVKQDDLVDWKHIEGRDLSDSVEVVFTGQGISEQRADAVTISTILLRFSRFWKDLGGGNPYIERFAFEGSVHVRFTASGEEMARAARETLRVEELEREDPDNPALPSLLRETITDVQLAGALAADLLAAPVDEVPRIAASFGTEVAQAYKSFTAAVAKENVTVSVEPPTGGRPVTLTSPRADLVTKVLASVSEPRVFTEILVGVLSIADANQHTFGLQLDREIPRPPAFKNKRIVRGRYELAVGDRMRDEGLWGKRVKATVRVEKDAVVSTSTLRPASYTLVDVVETVA